MLVKFFAHPSGGGGSEGAQSSAEYLEGKDKNRIGAELLSGNLDLSVKIAQDTDFKNKYTVGCLSFEEADIPEESKEEIMQKFEKTIFAGLEKDQYNISWVEHTDKGRLELNFFIPNVELTTGKQYLPYFDKKDRGLVENFKQVINYEYGLTDPNDPEKKQAANQVKRIPKAAKDIKDFIDDYLDQEISKGRVESREDVKKALERIGLEVVRETKKNVSIKSPEGGRNIRLTGGIYEQAFRVEKESERSTSAERDYGQKREEAYRAALRELTKRIEQKKSFNSKKYRQPNKNAVLEAPSASIDRVISNIRNDRGSVAVSEARVERDNQTKRRDQLYSEWDQGELGQDQRTEIRLSKEERSDKYIGSEDGQYRAASSQSKTITRRKYQDEKRARSEQILEGKADELLKEVREDFRGDTGKLERPEERKSRISRSKQRAKRSERETVKCDNHDTRAFTRVGTSERRIDEIKRAISGAIRRITEKIQRIVEATTKAVKRTSTPIKRYGYQNPYNNHRGGSRGGGRNR